MKKSLIFLALLILLLTAVLAGGYYIRSKTKVYHLPPSTDRLENEIPSPTPDPNVESRPPIKLKTSRELDSEIPLKETKYWKSYAEEEETQKELATIRRARIVKVLKPSLEYEIELLSDQVHKIMKVAERTDFAYPEYTFDENQNMIYVNLSNGYSKELLSTLHENSTILIYVEDPKTLRSSSTITSIEPKWIVSAD